MKLSAKINNQGVVLTVGGDETGNHAVPQADANQTNPRRFYVYAHCDAEGRVFYVGKGLGGRAWSRERHPLWVRYVQKHLGGEIQVRILADNLTPDEAEEREADFIAQYGDSLVNWFNMARSTDYEAISRYHQLRNSNRALILRAKASEKESLEEAASLYLKALDDSRVYAFMSFEKGLVGQLLAEETAELGWKGELEALDRLTLCLIKLGRAHEAAARMNAYFALYRRDLALKASERIRSRVQKGLACTADPGG